MPQRTHDLHYYYYYFIRWCKVNGKIVVVVWMRCASIISKHFNFFSDLLRV